MGDKFTGRDKKPEYVAEILFGERDVPKIGSTEAGG